MEFIYEKLCIYSYIFKLHSPSKYSPFDTIHLSRCFFHYFKQFLNSSIVMPFSTSAIFCFTSSTLAKRFPLRTFSIQRNEQKKSCSGQDGVNGEGGARGSCRFWSRLLNTQRGVSRCAQKSPIMKWANVLKESSKKFTEAKHSISQQRQLAH